MAGWKLFPLHRRGICRTPVHALNHSSSLSPFSCQSCRGLAFYFVSALSASHGLPWLVMCSVPLILVLTLPPFACFEFSVHSSPNLRWRLSSSVFSFSSFLMSLSQLGTMSFPQYVSFAALCGRLSVLFYFHWDFFFSHMDELGFTYSLLSCIPRKCTYYKHTAWWIFTNGASL